MDVLYFVDRIYLIVLQLLTVAKTNFSFIEVLTSKHSVLNDEL